jgi:hypothetical protein
MSLPFARTLRALEAERYRPSLLALLVSMGLVGLWATWFFLAPMTRTTTGPIVGTTRRGTVLTTLARDAAASIRRGQDAMLSLQGPQTHAVRRLPSTVLRVTYKGEEARVELSVEPSAAASFHRQEHLTGQAEFVIEHLSPAAFLARTTGPDFRPPASASSPVPR